MGTPYWMAPEIIEMTGTTTACDVWSVGCTIIELLEGKPPYFDLPQAREEKAIHRERETEMRNMQRDLRDRQRFDVKEKYMQTETDRPRSRADGYRWAERAGAWGE